MAVVSVVLAARNEAAHVERAVRSILGQTLDDWELVVVDDGSTDGTAAIVESFGDPRIRVVRQRQGGLPRALNRGTDAAAAPLIARQDADDYSLPHRLAEQVAFLDANPDVAVVGSAWREVDGAGRSVRPRARVVAGSLNEILPRYNPITHTTATFRRDAVLAVGGYDERFPYAADYDLWLRLAAAGALVWNLDSVLAVRVMTGTNMSAESERARVWEEIRVRWRDLQRRRTAGQPPGPQVRRIAARAPVLLVPVWARRLARRWRGQAP